MESSNIKDIKSVFDGLRIASQNYLKLGSRFEQKCINTGANGKIK